MTIEDLTKLFLDSRRRGMTGARKKCSDKTITIYAANMKLFQNFIQGLLGSQSYAPVKRLDLIAFTDWIDSKVKAGDWSVATSLQVLRTLRVFFRWIDRDEECNEEGLKGLQRYLPSIEKNPRRTDIPQIDVLTKFKDSCNQEDFWEFRDFVVVCLLMDTGIRLGEVCNLRIDHVRMDDRVMIVEGKTGPRPVPFTQSMARLLRGWLRRRDTRSTAKGSPYVFISKREPKTTVSALGHSFNKRCAAMKLPRITAHTFRHAFCTHYLRQGGDLEKLRMMTGHTTYDMLREYLHLAKVGGKSVQEELERVSLLKAAS